MKGRILLGVIATYLMAAILLMRSNATINHFKKHNSDEPEQLIKNKLNILNDTIHQLLWKTKIDILYIADNEKIQIELFRNENNHTCNTYNMDATRTQISVSSIWKDYLDVRYDDVTMIVQLTMDSIKLLEIHAEFWSGPMSVSLYANVDELDTLAETLAKMTMVIKRNNIDLHIVLQVGVRIFDIG